MSTSIDYTDEELGEYFTYLDLLRESGKTNMFGAGSYLLKEFPELGKKQANQILGRWMFSFAERHKENI